MKANELMIGDWLYNEELECKVSAIYTNGIMFEDRIGAGAVTFDRLKPIPLTTEILEKNGYVKDEDIRGYVSFCHRITFHHEDEFKNTGNSWYVHVDNNCFDSIGSIEVTYVHQFQQFLRLCGYSEMAEEFKV